MVNTLRNSANELMKQGLFDYLNLNRHKFNKHGQFDAAPDEQDYVPHILLVSDEFIKPPKLAPETPRLNRAQQFRAKYPEANMLRNPLTDEDYVLKRYNERLEHAKKRRKYKKSDCDTHLDAAMKRCGQMYWNNALYPKDAYDGCAQRANELWQECYNKKRYPEGKMEWANRDMDIIDEAPTSDQDAIKSDSVNWSPLALPMMAPPYDLNARAKAQMFRPPRLESSMPANDNFPGNRRPISLQRPSLVIRGTPAMGNSGSLGGISKGFISRYPVDSRAPMKQY